MMFSKIVVATILPSVLVSGGLVQPNGAGRSLLQTRGGGGGGGAYCPTSLSLSWGGTGLYCLQNELYECSAPGEYTTKQLYCPSGCYVARPGIPDGCNEPSPPTPYPNKPDSDSCRVLDYEVVKCEEFEVHKTKIVETVSIVQACKNVTEYKEFFFDVEVERDICTPIYIAHEFITKIPTQKQDCKTKSDGSISCELKTIMKEVPTTDYTCVWDCGVGTNVETQKVTLPTDKETCQPVEVIVEQPVKYTVKEKTCRVIKKSKEICTTTDVKQLFEAQMSSYSIDEATQSFSLIEAENVQEIAAPTISK